MSLDDYNSFQETMYLLQPSNAAALDASIKQYEDGKLKQHKELS